MKPILSAIGYTLFGWFILSILFFMILWNPKEITHKLDDIL